MLLKIMCVNISGIIGRASISFSCDSNQHCRPKRQATTPHAITIETSEALFYHQHDETAAIKPIIIKLAPTSFPLIGPNYKLVIRNDDADEKKVLHTVPLPNCLFNGTLLGREDVQFAVSTCNPNKLVSPLPEIMMLLTYHFNFIFI